MLIEIAILIDSQFSKIANAAILRQYRPNILCIKQNICKKPAYIVFLSSTNMLSKIIVEVSVVLVSVNVSRQV